MSDWVGKLALVSMFVGLALAISIELYPSAQWGSEEQVLLSLGGLLFLGSVLLLGSRNSTHKHL